MNGQKKTEIVFLYAEVMGYLVPVFKCLAKKHNCNITVIRWDKKLLTPYIPDTVEHVTYKSKSEFKDAADLISFVEKLDPQIIYVSGWMDRDYLKACRHFKRRGCKVIAGIDTQWKAKPRQYLAKMLAPFFIKPNYTHLMVAGAYQFEYGKKLGFRNDQIILGVYSADVDLFKQSIEKRNAIEHGRLPRRFVYVGRFASEKGLQTLVNVWNRIGTQANGWSLCFIGNGPLKEELKANTNIEIKDFMQPEVLVEEIANAGCFILPSNFEPWGVVIHEFAAAGLPMIISNACGAASDFLRHGYNGYSFEASSETELEEAMLKVISASDSQLKKMSENSIAMSSRITPDLIAANILSVLTYGSN